MDSLLTLTWAITTYVTRAIGTLNALQSIMSSSFRDFVRINPLIFLGSKVGKDPEEFLDGVCKVFSAMGMTSR